MLDGLLVTSKHLITALEKSDWMDRMLVLAGLAFFVLVVAFILKQRIVDRGLRIAFWWTRFIPDFSSDEELLNINMEEAKIAVSAVTGTAVSVAVSVSSAVAVAAASASLTLAPVLASSSYLGEPSLSVDSEATPTSLEVLSNALFTESSSPPVSEDSARETGPHDEL